MSIKKKIHNTDADVNQTNVIILHVHPHIVGLSCTCHLDAVQIQNVYLYIPLNPSVHEIDRYKLRTFTCLFSSFYQYGSLLNTSSFKCIPIAVVHVFTCSVCAFVSALEDCHSLPGTHRAITVISISWLLTFPGKQLISSWLSLLLVVVAQQSASSVKNSGKPTPSSNS